MVVEPSTGGRMLSSFYPKLQGRQQRDANKTSKVKPVSACSSATATPLRPPNPRFEISLHH